MFSIYLAVESPWACGCLVDLLAGVPSLRIMGQSADAAAILRLIRWRRPDVLLVDLPGARDGGLRLLRAVKDDIHSPLAIMLADCAIAGRRQRWIDAGADLVLDKATEFGRVREVMHNLVTQFYIRGGFAKTSPIAAVTMTFTSESVRHAKAQKEQAVSSAKTFHHAPRRRKGR